MKIILDFDDTIFNTHRLMQEFLEIFKKFNFTEEEFWNTYQECKKKVGDFDQKIMIDLLSEIKLFDKTKAEDKINLILNNLEDFIYPDFFDFVKDFNKEDLILLSFGTADSQGMKIKNSGIALYFQEIIITQKDKAEDLKNILIKNEGEKIFFIDDKTEQVDRIKEKLSQIITIKIERPQGSHVNTKSKLTDYVVKGLDETERIIKKIR